MSEVSFQNDEAIIAQCLISMANIKAPTTEDPPPQCDEPSADDSEGIKESSGDNNTIDTKQESNNNNKIDTIDMIPHTSLPGSNQWEQEKYVSSSSSE